MRFRRQHHEFEPARAGKPSECRGPLQAQPIFIPPQPAPARIRRRGFTLIELLVVVGIIGIVMTISIPSIYRQLHPDSMQKAVTDILEACTHARAMAILNRAPVDMRISPLTRGISVGGSSASSSGRRLESHNVAGEEWRMPERGSSSSAGGGSFSAKISDRIQIKLIDVNFVDFTDAEMAAVRFFPNGTSDEFTIVLTDDQNEWRMISLEVVTGLADVETDMQKVLEELR